MYKTLIIFSHKCVFLQCWSRDLVRLIYCRGAAVQPALSCSPGTPRSPPASGDTGRVAQPPHLEPPDSSSAARSQGLAHDREQPDPVTDVPARGRGSGLGALQKVPSNPNPSVMQWCRSGLHPVPPGQHCEECLGALPLP